MSRNENHHIELRHEWGEFLNAWQDKGSVWKDDVAGQFARRFVQPWKDEMPTFLSTLECLEEEIEATYRELR